MTINKILLILCLGCFSGHAVEINIRDKESHMPVKQKTIGMIGGVSWESTTLYYQLLNQSVREHLGGLNSAKILLYSLNYEPIVNLERQGKWEDVGQELAHAAQVLESGGADFIILCCNTLHKMTPSIEGAVQVPFLHIADPAGNVLVNHHIQKIGLLGTQFTMEDGFYHERLGDKFGLTVVVPSEEDRLLLDSIIYDELCQGKVLARSKQNLLQIIQNLREQGVGAILLGCTELGMLVGEEDIGIPVYDTTVLHANEAAKQSMKVQYKTISDSALLGS